MKRIITLITTLALVLATLASCSAPAGTPSASSTGSDTGSPMVTPSVSEPADPPVDTAEQKRLELLANSAKIKEFGHIQQYKGETYACSYLSLPQWNAVAGSYMDSMAVINGYLYYTSLGGTGEISSPLYRSDLAGNGEDVIINPVDSWGLYYVDNKIIYSSSNEETGSGATYCYDTITSSTVRLFEYDSLHPEVVSCDDDFIYYQKEQLSIWRISWDGSRNEAFSDWSLPPFIHTVDEKYFYVTDKGNYFVRGISRYSVSGNNKNASYSLPFGVFFLTIHDGLVYFSGDSGIYKVDMDTKQEVKLSDFPSECDGFGDFLAIVDDALFVTIWVETYEEHEDVDWNAKLYKAPLAGGEMEDMNKKWYES